MPVHVFSVPSIAGGARAACHESELDCCLFVRKDLITDEGAADLENALAEVHGLPEFADRLARFLSTV